VASERGPAAARDHVATIAAVGLLAYVAADVVHHAFGHGAGCMALGGRIASLSSTYVECTVRGSVVDLAGPFANLLVGAAALLWLRWAPRLSPAARLFLVLLAAFDLFWFSLQLAFSAATRTDDWAWAMHDLHAGEPARYALLALGLLGYAWAVRACGTRLAPFASPRARAGRIALVAWLGAGAIACATIVLDRQWPLAVSLPRALEQSLGLSIGLLFLPARAGKAASPADVAGGIGRSWPWLAAGAGVAAASVLLLGPGIAIGGR
jgi:hypothetical protein